MTYLLNCMDTAMKEYKGVDLGKLICALLVVIIHTKPFASIFWMDAGIGIITRFAVPFFFVASSLFLFIKIKESPEQANRLYRHYFIRVLVFYGIWYIIFSLEAAAYGIIYHPGYYFKQFFFNTSGSPLWFLCALLWSSGMVFGLMKLISKRWIMLISILSLVIGYMFSTLHPLFAGKSWFEAVDDSIIPFIGTQNGLFFGFPYVAMGALAAEWKFQKNHLLNISGIILSLLLLMGESWFAVRSIGTTSTFLWLSALPLTFFTLRLAMTANIPGNSNAFYLIRKSSTLIYVLHVLVMHAVAISIRRSGLSSFDRYHVIYFLLTAVITSGLAFLIVILSTRSRMRFLRYLM